MLRYLLVGLVIYWIVKRVLRVTQVVRNDGHQHSSTSPPKSTNNESTINHSEGGEYVDYEEIE